MALECLVVSVRKENLAGSKSESATAVMPVPDSQVSSDVDFQLLGRSSMHTIFQEVVIIPWEMTKICVMQRKL